MVKTRFAVKVAVAEPPATATVMVWPSREDVACTSTRYWLAARPPAPVVVLPTDAPPTVAETVVPDAAATPSRVTVPVTTVTPWADATEAKSPRATAAATRTLRIRTLVMCLPLFR
jgi:hypothetical protein